jgi:ADP-ribose pyrophosphatase
MSEDNLRIAAAERRGVAYSFCECAGLAEACAPIMAGGKPLAYWFYGKVRTPEVSGGNIAALAARVGADPDAALEAFGAMTNHSSDDIHHMAELLQAQAARLSDIAQRNFLLRRQIITAMTGSAAPAEGPISIAAGAESERPSSAMREAFISGDTLYQGKVFTARRDRVRLPDGKEALREVVLHSGGVAVLALDQEENVMMVRQFRYAAERETLEIPAGKLEPGEDPAEAAKRELSEETGCSCRSLVSMGTVLPTGGYCSEIIHLFFARGLAEGSAHPDDGEFLSAERVPLKKLEEMALSGELTDSKTLAALYRLRLRREKGDEENTYN